MGEMLIFEIKVRRALTVLRHLLCKYPEYMNIHELDSELNDPNRALSDLRNSDGFAHFLKEKRVRNVVHAKLDLIKLFQSVNKNVEIVRLYPYHLRVSVPKKQKYKIFDQFKGRCNLTGIELQFENNSTEQSFMKNSITAVYDHRRPLVKSGANEEYNLQLISKLANMEKNKICNSCENSKCEVCALAHPEKVSVIYPTGQDITVLRKC